MMIIGLLIMVIVHPSQVYNENGSAIYNTADVMRSHFHGAMLTAFGPDMPLPPAMAFQKGILGEDPPEAGSPSDFASNPLKSPSDFPSGAESLLVSLRP